jgi:hypothetical protein
MPQIYHYFKVFSTQIEIKRAFELVPKTEVLGKPRLVK